MKFDVGDIKDVVEETRRKRSQWMSAAEVWESDWWLSRYPDTPESSRELDGVTQAVSPDPFMIVQLLMRFVADEVRVEIPSISDKDDDEDRAEVMEEFTVAFEMESGRQQGRNLIQDKVWYSGVRGRGASQTLWIKDVLPKGMSSKKLPILKRNLDPFNVGVARGPYWTDYGYHEYKATRSDIQQRYPNYKFKDKDRHSVQGYWNEKYRVIDFYNLHAGSIWHQVVIDDQFAKRPTQTDYPDIPFVEWYADGAPIDNELARSLSILHPIHELWKLKCNLLSSIATGMDYHYHPMIIARDIPEQKKLEVGPGAIVHVSGNQAIEPFRAEPNVPMAEKLLMQLQTAMDQATFPSVTYGEGASGASGYAINSLSQAARSRANIIRGNIEGAMEAENQLLYGLIEAMAPDEGVQVYGRSARGDRGKPLKLNAKVIKGNWANRVTLVPEQPMDDNARIMAWLQMVEKNIVSESMMRNRVLNVQTPRDEEARIALQNALKQPNMQLKVQLRSIQHNYPAKEWERMIVGTELEPVWQAEQAWVEQKAAEEEAAKEARRQEKQQREMEEQMAQMQQMQPPPMPPEMMGMPPGMSGSMPPGQPPMMPPGSMPFDPSMGMPPQDPSLQGPGGPMPMPPDMGMQPPGLAGVPPEMAGQMTPEMLGIPPQQGIPGQFDMMMGGPPPTDEEMMQQLGGTPPPMF